MHNIKQKSRWKKTALITFSVLIVLVFSTYYILTRFNTNFAFRVGEPIDQLNGITVFYNGGVNHVSGRNTSLDGYNIGLKHQCVEFVKRYYYEYLNHKMPNSYGHAKDFFNSRLNDGELNTDRSLFQFSNPSKNLPKVNDLVIFAPWLFNRFGHVAIISKVTEDQVEIIQQNPGPFGTSREVYPLIFTEGEWVIKHDRLLGWLRKN